MMHPGSVDARSRTRDCAAKPVAVLAYRSRPVSPPSMTELDQILVSAQRRNRSEGLTGLLIYDQGHYFQWLEGPRRGLMRVWESIRADPRHREFKILRRQTIPVRLFDGWDMRLACRTRGEIDRVLAVMQAPHELLTRLQMQPSSLADSAWDRVFAEDVIPRLRPSPAAAGRNNLEKLSSSIWHAHREAGAELAVALQSVDPDATALYIDMLINQGAGIQPLFHEVFEPAARFLGHSWESDRCNGFDVTLAMGRLQLEVRRLTSCLQPAAQVGHAVLVAPQPGEVHSLGARMCAELFCEDGWDVSTEIAIDDDGLRDVLHDRWFDILELCSSTALRRDHRLPAMRVTIGAARAASLNPALAVMVDGRSFFERPQAYLEVGADMSCGTSTDVVGAAHRLLRSHNPPPSGCMGANVPPPGMQF